MLLGCTIYSLEPGVCRVTRPPSLLLGFLVPRNPFAPVCCALAVTRQRFRRLSFQTAPPPRVHWAACDTMSAKQEQSPAHWSKLAFVREEQLEHTFHHASQCAHEELEHAATGHADKTPTRGRKLISGRRPSDPLAADSLTAELLICDFGDPSVRPWVVSALS
jgi:hypothetical protein